MVNYYEVLGIAPTAGPKEIKKAYYKLAKKYHPDHNVGDEAAADKFKEISDAYQCLSDEGKRRQYDEELKNPKTQPGMGKSAAGRSANAGRKSSRSAGTSGQGIDFENVSRSFEAFYGFNPKTGEVTDEENLRKYTAKERKKNPLDVSDMFEKFMGINKR